MRLAGLDLVVVLSESLLVEELVMVFPIELPQVDQLVHRVRVRVGELVVAR